MPTGQSGGGSFSIEGFLFLDGPSLCQVDRKKINHLTLPIRKERKGAVLGW